jgi:ferredoxin
MDSVEVCPVDCFYVGENMLVIHPAECINCGVCEPECPAEAIVPDSDDRAAAWAERNRVFSMQWPNITRKGTPPDDAGRHTFRTFGWVEMALTALLGLSAAAPARRRPLALAPGLIVLAQAFWLRPRLDARTRQVADGGETPPPSDLHLAYVACGVAKLAVLLGLGLTGCTAGRDEG